MSFERARGERPIIRISRQHVRDPLAGIVVAADAITFFVAIYPTYALQSVRHRLRRFNEKPGRAIRAAVQGGAKTRKSSRLKTAAATRGDLEFCFNQQPGCGVQRGKIERHMWFFFQKTVWGLIASAAQTPGWLIGMNNVPASRRH